MVTVLTGVVRGIAISAAFIFNALDIQHSALLQYEMRFATLAAIDTGALMLGIAVAIAAVVRGFGYWVLHRGSRISESVLDCARSTSQRPCPGTRTHDRQD